jgi:hypothetical protein
MDPMKGEAVRRTTWQIILVLGILGAIAWVWPTIYRYDKIDYDQDTYIVRINRVTGHADILVPEQGWIPAEEPWDTGSPTVPGDGHT